jgi:serine/threonine protein kinase
MLVQSDVYSFGVIMYELLAGVVPFPLLGKGETSRNAVLVSHMEKPLPDILELRAQYIPQSWEESRKDFEMRVPAWLLDVISRCLEKRPENRYSSGIELHKAIIESSKLYVGTYAYDSTDSAVLRRENERLKALLMQYQETSNALPASAAVGSETIAPKIDSPFRRAAVPRRGAMLSSRGLKDMKPVLIGLGILLFCLAVFAGYSSFNSPKSEVIDSDAFNAEKQRISDSIDTAEKLQAQNAQDSIDELRRSSANAESSRPRYEERDDNLSEKEWEKQRKNEEKYWERKNKKAEKLREELKKEFEKLGED